MSAPGHLQLGVVPVPEPGPAPVVLFPSRDGFADPPGLAVRADVLTAVAGPEPVRGGALADLVARLAAAGHEAEVRETRVPPRRPTPAALHREGSARLWLFRRHPERFPLPRPLSLGWRLPFVAVGALHANGWPTRPRA